MKEKTEIILSILRDRPEHKFTVSELFDEYKNAGGMGDFQNPRKFISDEMNKLANIVKKEKQGRNVFYYYNPEVEYDGDNQRPTQSQLFSSYEAQYIIDSILSSKSISEIGKNALIRKVQANSNVKQSFLQRNNKKIDTYTWTNSEHTDIIYNVEAINEAILDQKIIQFEYTESQPFFKIKVVPWCFRRKGEEVLLCATKTSDFDNKDFWDKFDVYKVERITELKIINNSGEEKSLKNILKSNPNKTHSADKGLEYEYDQDEYRTLPFENLFVNLKTIERARATKKKIRFYYIPAVLGDNSKEAITVSPIDCAFSNSKYMLFALNDRGEVQSFRVEFIDGISIEDQNVAKEIEEIDLALYIIHHSNRSFDRAEFLIPADRLHEVYEEFGFEFKARRVVLEDMSEGSDKKVRTNYSSYKPSTKRLLKIVRGNLPDEFIEFKDMLKVTVQDTTEEEVFRFALTHADAVKVISPPSLRARLINTARFMKNYNEEGITKYDYIYLKYYDAINRKILEYNEETCQDFMDICDIAYDEGQLLKITDVKLSGKEVKSLDIIAKLKGIEYLSLENTEIRNLSELKGFNRLTQLILKNSPIDNWKVLKELPKLSSLEVIGIPTDKDVLLKLKNLKQLTLNGTGIEDASVLLNSPQLPNLAFVIIDGQRYEKKQ